VEKYYRVSKIYTVRVWAAVSWLRVWSSGGLLWTRYWISGFHKWQRISWTAIRLSAY